MKSTVLLVAALVAVGDALPETIPTRLWHKANNVVARYVYGTQLPVAPVTLGSVTSQGCFKSSGSLVYDSVQDYNSIGKCGGKICPAKGYAVGASTGGNQCWCGDEYPPKADKVDDKNCDVGCTGYGQEACGGIDFWSVYNTGKTLSVKYEGEESSSSSASKTATATSSASATAKTVVVTAAPTETASSGGGSNTAGIVAGVVVGVVVIASAIGGGYLYMRRKRNKEIEEEHRRNAAVNAFVGKPPGSSAGSMTDSRMDPVMAHRRMSDGSIADNQDYSRRILRVTNA